MNKLEKLKPERKIKFKCFLLANILTLFFALATIALAAGNSFDFNQETSYSEPFSQLIEFLNAKKNELEKYDDDFFGAKAFRLPAEEEGGNNNSVVSETNFVASSFASAVFGSVKSFVVDNPRQYFGTVFESVKNFVFPGDSQNSFEYKSPTSEENAKEIENLKQQYASAIDEAKAISQKFSLLQSEMGKIKAGGIIVKEPVVEQRIVERTIEKIVSGLSQNDLDSGISSVRTELQNLNTNLTSQINTLSAQTNRQTAATYQTISLSNKIDNLSNVTISNPTITGTLTNQTFSNSGNATISGTLTAGGTSLSSLTVSGTTGLTGLATIAISTTTNATITDNFWSNGSTYIGDVDADTLAIRAGTWSLTSTATSTVAMTNGLNFDSNTFVIDPNSNRIGIGTSSPYAKLSVVGPVVAEYFHATSTAATSTFSGQTVAGFAPTLAHSFGSWSVGAAGANPLGASFIINPSSATADSNLLSLSVNGSAKFLVDAEGDVFANAITVVGGTTLSTTTASTFTVEGNTILGDATTTDITYFNSRIADSLIPTADNALDLGDSTNWLRWRTGYFGTSVGIGGTATSTGTQLTASGAYLIDSKSTLSLNTTNNQAVSFGTGNVVLPYASSTALTVSGSAYLGSLNGPLQANNGLVSATTSVGSTYGGTGINSAALTGIAQIVAGTWSASSTLSVAFGGTGWNSIQANSILLGNGAGRLATTTAGTDGYVLALSAGVPTWLATSTLSTITGTLAVAKGGTGQTSFGQGWLNSDGTTLTSSTSPTVNYITATSTAATSTFPYLSVTTNSNLGTVVGGAWQGTAVGAQYGGTGQNFSASSGLVNFYSGAASTIATSSLGLLTTNVAEGTNLYWTNDRFDTRLSATTTLPNLTTLLGLINATTTGITSTNSWLGTIRSGTWNGTAISNQYGGTGLDSSALTGIAQIVAGTWSASSTLSAAYGGTGWNSIQANTILLGNGAGRLATTTAGTDGYVLALSAGVPTWLATSTLSTITGTLAVAKGGTGQTSFGQGWLNSDGTTLSASTSPTVNYLTATSTTATSTFAGGMSVAGSSGLTVLNNGNVGIGTAAPGYKMEVNGTSYFAGTLTVSNGEYIKFGSEPGILWFNSQKDLALYPGTGHKFVIGGSWFGGSGTDHANQTNPTLFIHDATNPGTTNNKWGSLAHDGTGFVVTSGANTGAGASPATIDNYIAFAPRGTERVRIDGAGNLGLGTTSPQSLLTVGSSTPTYLAAGEKYNSAYISGLLEVGGTGTSTIKNNLYVVGTLRAAVSYVGDLIFANGFKFTEADPVLTGSNALYLQNQFGSTTLAIDENGNIGIGTTSPAYKLQVMGDVAATSFVNISTKDAKKDISYLTSSQETDFLNKIKTTNLAQYHYNIENDSNPLRLGLIAEEAPAEILSVDGKGVDVYKMATFTLGGVKALQKEIEKMKIDLVSLQANTSASTGTGTDGLFAWITEKFKTAFGIEFGNEKIKVKNLCVGETCVTEEQFKAVFGNSQSASSSSSSSSSAESSSASSTSSSSSSSSSSESSSSVSSNSSESSSSSSLSSQSDISSSSSEAVSSSESSSSAESSSSSEPAL